MNDDFCNIPEKEPSDDVLKNNIKGLKDPYIYHNGYVYYIIDRSLWRSRYDGNDILELYFVEDGGQICNIYLEKVDDGYVYFNVKNVDYGDGYCTEDTWRLYRVKTDNSRELQLRREWGDCSIYTGATSDFDRTYDPPINVENPVKWRK